MKKKYIKENLINIQIKNNIKSPWIDKNYININLLKNLTLNKIKSNIWLSQLINNKMILNTISFSYDKFIKNNIKKNNEKIENYIEKTKYYKINNKINIKGYFNLLFKKKIINNNNNKWGKLNIIKLENKNYNAHNKLYFKTWIQYKNKININIGLYITNISYKKIIYEQRKLFQIRKIYNEYIGKKIHIYNYLRYICENTYTTNELNNNNLFKNNIKRLNIKCDTVSAVDKNKLEYNKILKNINQLNIFKFLHYILFIKKNKKILKNIPILEEYLNEINLINVHNNKNKINILLKNIITLKSYILKKSILLNKIILPIKYINLFLNIILKKSQNINIIPFIYEKTQLIKSYNYKYLIARNKENNNILKNDKLLNYILTGFIFKKLNEQNNIKNIYISTTYLILLLNRLIYKKYIEYIFITNNIYTSIIYFKYYLSYLLNYLKPINNIKYNIIEYNKKILNNNIHVNNLKKRYYLKSINYIYLKNNKQINLIKNYDKNIKTFKCNNIKKLTLLLILKNKYKALNLFYNNNTLNNNLQQEILINYDYNKLKLLQNDTILFNILNLSI